MSFLNTLRVFKRNFKYLVLGRYYIFKHVKPLFVIGHMRSGSTLLVHILTSNSEIDGIGELHVKSDNLAGFGKTVSKVDKMLNSKKIDRQYVLNKILHTFYLPNLSSFSRLCKLTSAKIVILIRHPEKAIPSIIGLRLPDSSTYTEAGTYYIKQLQFIKKMVHIIPKDKYFFVTYEELVDQNSDVLIRLSAFLNLSTALTHRYDITRMTGKEKIGDPSQNILSGRILQDSEKVKQQVQYEFDEATYKTATNLFLHLREQLNNG